MQINRNSSEPLHIQFKSIILEKIKTGEFQPGNIIPTESEFCQKFGISRYPVRQALLELVSEGYLNRTRGKGSYVSEDVSFISDGSKTIGLIVNYFNNSMDAQILYGFEKEIRKKGYILMTYSSEGDPEEELHGIDLMIRHEVLGIFVLCSDTSKINVKIEPLKERGIYVGLFDRNPGVKDIDYVASDHYGGAYVASRHFSVMGFENIIYVTGETDVTSVLERMKGCLKGAEDHGIYVLNHNDIQDNEEDKQHEFHDHRFFVRHLEKHIDKLKSFFPLGILASNDYIALQCISELKSKGLHIGKEVGVIGFDNIIEGQVSEIPLTTVSQNGMLLGKTAAKMAIEKIETGNKQIYKSIIPTQLVIRRSCGEKF